MENCAPCVAHQLIGESCTPPFVFRNVCSMDLEHVACRDLRDEVRCLGRDAEHRLSRAQQSMLQKLQGMIG